MPIGRLADLEMGPKVLAQGAEIPTANRVRLVIFIGYSAFYWVYMKASDIAVPSGFFVTVNGKLRPLTTRTLLVPRAAPNSGAASEYSGLASLAVFGAGRGSVRTLTDFQLMFLFRLTLRQIP